MITFRNLGRVGRLGNQLFQIASTIGIARDLKQEPIFPADWLYRPYFNMPDEMFAEEIPADAVEATHYAIHIDPRARDYLQDLGLFLHHMDEIGELLYPNAAVRLTPNLCSHPHLGIHVRRGDNIHDPGVPNKADYHPTPPLDYYLRGIDHFGGGEVMPMWICSDDIPWCRENLPVAERYGNGAGYLKETDPQYGVRPPEDFFDLFMLMQCDAFVVSVSTFGIWAALLSQHGLRYPTNVVRPNRVYGPALDYIDGDLLFHPDWISLPCF